MPIGRSQRFDLASWASGVLQRRLKEVRALGRESDMRSLTVCGFSFAIRYFRMGERASGLVETRVYLRARMLCPIQ